MIKKLAWNTFKNTGNINTFLELMEVENVEKSLQNSSNINVTNQNGVYNSVNTNLSDKSKFMESNNTQNSENKKQFDF